MKKQKNDIDHIYDLFAIRIIIDTPPEREKPTAGWRIRWLRTCIAQILRE